MQVRTVFAGLLGVLILVLPAASQSSRETDEEAQQKAELAKLEADPALSVQANAAFLANNLRQPGVQRRPSGLQYKILQNGYGRHPGGTDNVEVYYTGTLINGKVFDGTSPGLPAYFQVGKVVPGWTEALQLMREGDHWIIWVPSNLGYSPADARTRGMPAYQTMVFDLRLLATRGPARPGTPECQADPDCASAAAQQQQQQQGQQ